MTITLLIATCDSYSFLWDNLVTLTNKYIEVKTKVVATETKVFYYPGYRSINDPSPHWGTRLLKAIEYIETEYVLLILDDYYFTKKFDKSYLEYITNLLDVTKYNKFCLECTGYNSYALIPFSEDIYIQHNSSEYLTTLQPSVWRTSYLKQILKETWSAWDFELIGSEENRHYNNKIFMQKMSPFYFNAVRKGKIISPGWSEIKEKEQLKDFVF